MNAATTEPSASDAGGPEHFARVASAMGKPPTAFGSWDDFSIQTMRLGPGGWSHPGSRFVRLTVPLSRPGRVRRRLPGDSKTWRSALKRQGTVTVTPPATEGDWEWLDPSHFGLMFLPETLVREAQDECGAGAGLSLRPAYAEHDPVIGAVFQAVANESGNEGRQSRLLVSSAALFLTRHVLATYGRQGRLHPHGAVDSIGLQRVLDAIDAQLDHDWSVPEMAREAGLSPFWFAHLFKGKTGVSPRRYVQARRLARARSMLARSGLSIGDIAAQCGFGSQSWFTTLFRQEYGIAPAAFRQHIQ